MHNSHDLPHFAPGDLVKLEDYPEWGLGRVQSAHGSRLTISFENVGKQSINSDVAHLTSVKINQEN